MSQEKVAPQVQPMKKPKRDTSRLGQSRIFTPEVIDDIHIKSELGRYRMRGFSLFKKIPHWDDLTFLPEFSRQVVAEFERRQLQHKVAVLPCGHYTTGETPYKFLDAWHLVRVVSRALRASKS